MDGADHASAPHAEGRVPNAMAGPGEPLRGRSTASASSTRRKAPTSGSRSTRAVRSPVSSASGPTGRRSGRSRKARPLRPLCVPDDRAGRRGGRHPPEGHAGDPDDAGRGRDLDDRASGRSPETAAAASGRRAPDGRPWRQLKTRRRPREVLPRRSRWRSREPLHFGFPALCQSPGTGRRFQGFVTAGAVSMLMMRERPRAIRTLRGWPSTCFTRPVPSAKARRTATISSASRLFQHAPAHLDTAATLDRQSGPATLELDAAADQASRYAAAVPGSVWRRQCAGSRCGKARCSIAVRPALTIDRRLPSRRRHASG